MTISHLSIVLSGVIVLTGENEIWGKHNTQIVAASRFIVIAMYKGNTGSRKTLHTSNPNPNTHVHVNN
uniref:Uncharacterized protein n=1 Tax=Arundo donax TaxID=35708 RepID=A0A0A9EAZ8_ARUDO